MRTEISKRLSVEYKLTNRSYNFPMGIVEKCVMEFADKVANLITETTNECTLTPYDGSMLKCRKQLKFT